MKSSLFVVVIWLNGFLVGLYLVLSEKAGFASVETALFACWLIISVFNITAAMKQWGAKHDGR